ncbi:unnamed protein product [Phaeothamnion confervicola]
MLLHLLGIDNVAVVLNKMDLVGYDRARYEAVRAEFAAYLETLGVRASAMIPVAAREGGNVVARAETMPWYDGPTLLEALDAFEPAARPVERPLRLPLQDVYKFDQRRIFAGRIESGALAVGDEIMFSPSNKTTRIRSIEAWSARPDFIPPQRAESGQSIGLTLEDEIVVQRGEIVSHVRDLPIETDVFRARLFWLGREPVDVGRRFDLRIGTQSVPADIREIGRIVGSGDLVERQGGRIECFDVADVTLRTTRLIALDDYGVNPITGRFVLADGPDVLGGGIVDTGGYPDQRASITRRSSNIAHVEHRVTSEARAQRNSHRGGVVWLTGLSGAGKSTIAIGVEQVLFARGFQVFVLDGDNVRFGLNANLGFGPADRAENIRRVGEVAALFAEAGFVAVTAFISPYRADRERARTTAEQVPGASGFHEIFIKAPLVECERRDPKGLYRKARAGTIREFTGVSAPYEEPDAPDLIVDTKALSVEASVEAVVDYILREFRG